MLPNEILAIQKLLAHLANMCTRQVTITFEVTVTCTLLTEELRAMGVLQSLGPAFGIDLIAFEEASPSLREAIVHDEVSV